MPVVTTRWCRLLLCCSSERVYLVLLPIYSPGLIQEVEKTIRVRTKCQSSLVAWYIFHTHFLGFVGFVVLPQNLFFTKIFEKAIKKLWETEEMQTKKQEFQEKKIHQKLLTAKNSPNKEKNQTMFEVGGAWGAYKPTHSALIRLNSLQLSASAMFLRRPCSSYSQLSWDSTLTPTNDYY